MKELKTLKDIEIEFIKEDDFEGCKTLDIIKAEAVKWVKEDLKSINDEPLLEVERNVSLQLVNRWMDRLNITEEDLK